MLVPPAKSRDTAAPDARTGQYIWTRPSNAWCWSAFLPDARVTPTIAGLAADLSGLPAAFLAVGDLDLFVHDNLDYVQRLLAAGCPVEAHVYSGAIHGFDRMVDAPVSQRLARELTGFLQRNLGQPKWNR
jgi:triacylglycerol lipase